MTDTVAMMTPVLSVDHLCFSYPERLLWRELSLTIGPGITLVRGGDGTGKTTLLRLLAGKLAAQSGKLAFGDIALEAQTKRYQQQVFWTEPATKAFDALTPLGYFEAQRQGSQKFAAVNAPLMSDLVDGFSLADFEVRTGLGRESINPQLDEAVQHGWLEISGDWVKPTELGMRFANDVMGLFLH